MQYIALALLCCSLLKWCKRCRKCVEKTSLSCPFHIYPESLQNAAEDTVYQSKAWKILRHISKPATEIEIHVELLQIYDFIMEQFITWCASSPQIIMNISCITLTAISMIIYKIYEINCPCQPGYNLIYGLMVIFFPPLSFFFFAFILSQHFVSLLLDLFKPTSKRKNKDVLSLALRSIMIKALVAPSLWIIVCLLDGKPVICAFSETIDAEQFGGFGNFTSMSTDLLLAKVPCKNFELLRSSSTRKAIHRFLKSISQAVGFLTILSLIVFAIASYLLSSIFNITASIRARYWTVFSDTEDMCFEEICLMYNCWMAERRIRSSFEDMEKHGADKETHGGDKKIISPWQMMDYIDQWHCCPPPVIYGHEALGPQLTDKLH